MNLTVSLISLLIGIVCAFFCYRFATEKGRNNVLWAVLGFFFAIIALIIIALLPSKRPQGVEPD